MSSFRVSRFAPLLGGVNSLLYTAVYFSYAKRGEITRKAAGNIPDSMRILLADCYLDRASFIMRDFRRGSSIDRENDIQREETHTKNFV